MTLPSGDIVITSDALKAGYENQCLDRRSPGGQRLLRMFLPAAGPVFDVVAVGGDLLAAGRLADNSAATLLRATWWGQSGCAAAGLCAGQAPQDCDDGKVCTADSCLPAGGCAHAAILGCLP